jgi:flagellar hook-basal body complex protein FliE
VRIGSTTPFIPPPPAPAAGPQPSSGASFADTVRSAVDEVNKVQSEADTATQQLATGDVQDIHQVLLALDHASNSFSLTMQVRNKVVEAYQEVMRMQV